MEGEALVGIDMCDAHGNYLWAVLGGAFRLCGYRWKALRLQPIFRDLIFSYSSHPNVKGIIFTKPAHYFAGIFLYGSTWFSEMELKSPERYSMARSRGPAHTIDLFRSKSEGRTFF